MKKVKQQLLLLWMLCFTFLAIAQNNISPRPYVVQLLAKNDYKSYYDTQTRLQTDIIKQGEEGEGTLEFWVKLNREDGTNTFEGFELTNLLDGSNEFKVGVTPTAISITNGNAVIPNISLSGDAVLQNDEWYHFGLVFDKGNRFSIYINGIRRASVQNFTVSAEDLYVTAGRADHLFLAEYRAWNRARTREQLEDNRLTTLHGASKVTLEDFNRLGLVIAYVDADEDVSVANLPQLKEARWHNVLSDIENLDETIPLLKYSSIRTGTNRNQIRTDFAIINAMADHPIFNLNTILLQASDGNGAAFRTDGRHNVRLRWPHVKDVNNYSIRRREVGGGSIGTIIHNIVKNDLTAVNVSDFIEYFDEDIVPGRIYEYTVIGARDEKEDVDGTDTGFVFHNGEVNGRVVTEGQIGVQDVRVAAVLKDGTEVKSNNSVLDVKSTGAPIFVNNVQVFEEANGIATIEFWYKTPVNSAEVNTVFKLDIGEIRINNDKIQIYLGNRLYLETNIKGDPTDWHHYALSVSPTGGALYLDGGLAPDLNNPRRADATTKEPFVVGLNRISQFSFNHEVRNNYLLDELRIWRTIRTPEEIFKHKDIILGSEDSSLIAYYRFDLTTDNEVYNQAIDTRGRLVGRSSSTFTTQNTEIPPIEYGVITDQNGNYSFVTLPGGLTTDSDFGYTFKPIFPNRDFQPITRFKQVAEQLAYTETESRIDQFVDISTFEIQGRVQYVVNNEGTETVYPVLTGTAIKVNGVVLRDNMTTEAIGTNSKGSFRFDSPQGRHTFSIHPTILQSTNINASENTRQNVTSIFFEGRSGYLELKEPITTTTNQLTWTGHYRRTINNDPEAKLRATQTIMHHGSLKIQLIDEAVFSVSLNDQVLKQVTLPGIEENDFEFFAVAVNEVDDSIRILYDGMYEVIPIPSAVGALDFNTKAYLGATHIENPGEGEDSKTDFYAGYIDEFEYRIGAYPENLLRDIADGENIIEDNDNDLSSALSLRYTFEHNEDSFRAVNTIVKKGSIDNNYFSVFGDASFDDSTRAPLERGVHFEYIAANKSYNPVGDTYTLNVDEAITELNFENLTRHSLIGNIIIPCDNNIGAWTGTITRSDIREPPFVRNINATNFDSEFKVFTVNDLIPGTYELSLTSIQNPTFTVDTTVDLRRGNAIQDIEYRNEMQVETKFYELSDAQNSNDERGIGNEIEIDSNCIDRYVFQQYDRIVAVTTVYEEYNGQRCLLEGVTVNYSGDLIRGMKRGDNEEDESTIVLIEGNVAVETNSLGNAVLQFEVNTANFIEAADPSKNFLRGFTATAERGISSARETKTSTIDAIVTGVQAGNADFTFSNPSVLHVLHDPPGDNSFATLEEGASFSKTSTYAEGTDVSGVFFAGGGADFQVRMSTGTFVGVGSGSTLEIENTVTGSTIDVLGSGEFSFSYRNTGGNGRNVSINRSVSTPSFDTYVGEDADVFIGTTDVIAISRGNRIEIENCKVVKKETNIPSVTEETPFAVTQQHIIDVTIPTLERQIASQTQGLNIEDLKNQVQIWKDLVAANKRKREALVSRIQNNQSLARGRITYQDLIRFVEVVEDKRNEIPSTLDNLDQFAKLGQNGFSFGGGVPISYSFTRSISEDDGKNFGGGAGAGFSYTYVNNLGGGTFTFGSNGRVIGTRTNTRNESFSNTVTESFTFSDDDDGDQFFTAVVPDPDYGSPMFGVHAGRSMCPFEAGTQPRQGVEIVIDNAIGFNGGNDFIEYDMILRNTQLAQDDTRKIYYVQLINSSNLRGAQIEFGGVKLNSVAGNRASFPFGLDEDSPVGVVQEIRSIMVEDENGFMVEKPLRMVVRPNSADVGKNVRYEDIRLRFYADCEQAGDGFAYQSYRQDEYRLIGAGANAPDTFDSGIRPVHEITFTADFSAPCVDNIEVTAPIKDWVINNSSNNKLDFRFKIPNIENLLADRRETRINTQTNVEEVVMIPSDFQVAIEYAIEGNNRGIELVTLDAEALKANLDTQTGFITYTAEMDLANGNYSVRLVPICDPLSNNPNARNNPTDFISGTINKTAAVLVSTNPANNGIYTSGSISAEFSGPINPATVNLNSVALRGVLGGLPKELVSVEIRTQEVEIEIPHRSVFNAPEAFTVEMWVNPSTIPSGTAVPILQKGNNYKVALTPSGHIEINDSVRSTQTIQPSIWTHIAAVYDGSNAIQIYFNGEPVGSGIYTTGVTTNTESIMISPEVNGESYVGGIDDVRIWTDARTPIEIVQNLDGQLLGNETNLVAYFVLDDNALEVDGIQEAIRDYTGNARATTKVGDIFHNDSGEAAPLDVSRLVSSLEFEHNVSSGGTILNIRPLSSLANLEGAQLTLLIANEGLRDITDNNIEGASRSFIVNLNAIRWSQNNVNRVQVEGEELIIDDVDFDNSQGGIDVEYRFTRLPVWLSVRDNNGFGNIRNIDEGERLSLDDQAIESNLEFVVAPFLTPGIHTTTVYAEVFDNSSNPTTTGTSLGIESFTLEIVTNCVVPDYDDGFSNGDYLGSSDFTSRLIIDGEQSTDVNDIVAVYIDGEFRGSINVNSRGLVDLSVFGDRNDNGKRLSFRVWDASECTEYEGIVERHYFQFRADMGNQTVPIKFTVGNTLTRRIVVSGKNFDISFNVSDNPNVTTLSLDAIEGLTKGDILIDAETLDDKNPVAKADETGTLIAQGNNPNTIDIRKSYVLQRLNSAQVTLIVSGAPVDVNTNISLNGDAEGDGDPNDKELTPIAFLPSELQRTAFALRSLTSSPRISIGDRIERRGLRAEYTAEDGWVGALTHLLPGHGYTMDVTNAMTLNYSGLVDKTNEASKMSEASLSTIDEAAQLNWKVDRGDYLRFMYMTAVVNAVQFDISKEYTIAAFAGEELRGVSKAQLVKGKYHYFIGIGGSSSNEEITFKLFDGEKIVTLDNVEEFDTSVSLGAMKAPYVLNYTPNSETEEVVLNDVLGLSLGQNIPNPMIDATQISYSIPEDGHVDISLYNVLGQKVYTFVSDTVKGNVLHTVDWDGIAEEHVLSSGIYVYKLNYEGQELQRKLVIE
ncbi:LamG-like jellyroll fold domain-containing protein [Aquimarina rhabdastrellae]